MSDRAARLAAVHVAPASRRVREMARAWTVPALALVLGGWWMRLAHELALAGLASRAGGPPPALLVASALAVRVAGWGVEAAFYAFAWRAAGARLPLLRLARAIALCSLCDLAAFALRARPEWAGAPWVAWLAGPVTGMGDGTLAFVAGGFGLLAVARMVGTAGAQAAGLGCGPGAPFALTLATVALTRLAPSLAAGLARGRSPW